MTAHPAPAVFAAMLHAVDDLDWDTARASFANEVAIDYTSLWGGEPSTMAADELLRQWQGLAPGFDATQHLLGPSVVTSADEQTIVLTTNIRAYHHIIEESGATTWLVVGRYVVTLARESGGWRISGITLHTMYEEGDRRLVELAQQRSAAGAGGRAGS